MGTKQQVIDQLRSIGVPDDQINVVSINIDAHGVDDSRVQSLISDLTAKYGPQAQGDPAIGQATTEILRLVQEQFPNMSGEQINAAAGYIQQQLKIGADPSQIVGDVSDLVAASGQENSSTGFAETLAGGTLGDDGTAGGTGGSNIFGGSLQDVGADDQGNLIQRDDSGNFYVNGSQIDLSNTYRRQQVQQAQANGVPGGSGSGGGLSANVAAQIGSNEKIAFANLAQDAEQFAQSLQLQTQTLEEQIRQANQQYALSLEQIQLDKDRLSLSEVQGRRDDALQLTSLVANQENVVNDQRIQLTNLSTQAKQFNAELQSRFQEFRAGLEAQIGQFNANAQNQTAQFNASQELQANIQNAQNELTAALATANQAFQAAQASADRAVNLAIATDQALSRNIDQQIAIAAQIADFSRDPGDIVANIAALDQFGDISSAISEGFSAITEESLQPLATTLNAQESAQTEESRLRDRAAGLEDAIQQALDPNFGVQQVEAPTIAAPTPVEAATVQTPELAAPTGVNSDFDALMASLGGTDVQGLFNDILGTLPQTNVDTSTGTLQPAQEQPEPVITDPGLLNFIEDTAAAGAGDVNVGASALADPEKLAAFFAGFEFGGMAPPNTPVRVGDSSDGKENEELAMVDENGNLIVMPMDRLPKAEHGGIFHSVGAPVVDSDAYRARLGGATSILPQTEPQVVDPNVQYLDQEAADRLAYPNAPVRSTYGDRTFDMGLAEFNASRTDTRDQIQPLSQVNGTRYLGGSPTFDETGTASSDVLRARLSGASTLPQTEPQVVDPNVRYLDGGRTGSLSGGITDTNPLVQAASAGNPGTQLTNTDDARQLLLEAFQKAVQRFQQAAPNIPTGAAGIPSPVNVSAPGTSRFVQDAAAGLAQSGLGIKKELFNEALARVTPRGVQQGVARRTA